MFNYILKGAPGSGKTTVLHALKDYGYYCVEEAATGVMYTEQSFGISESWTDPSFIAKILELQIQRENLVNAHDNPVHLFDRSPLCTYVLCTFLGYPLPHNLLHEISRITHNNIYENEVLFIDNLGFIQSTAARKISFRDALKFEQLHKKVYQQFGYRLLHIPAMDIKKRTDAVINTLRSLNTYS